jgi:hypothetical protein
LLCGGMWETLSRLKKFVTWTTYYRRWVHV